MRNEERRIVPCLDSILANDFDHGQMEILVVDGRSTDRSREVVMQQTAGCRLIRLLDNPAKIVSAGLNLGIRNARGNVIIIMGAHTEYSENYISTCLLELENRQADVVGGVLETRSGGESLIARSVALMSQHRFGVGGSGFRTHHCSGYVDTVPYGAYRREVFEQVGLFNENLTRNQDFELNARIQNSGGRLFLSTDVKAAYYSVPTLVLLARQAFNNGYWLPRMWFVSPSSTRLRHAVPAIFVMTLVLSLLVAPLHAIAGLPGLIALGMYAIALVAVSAHVASQVGAKFLFPMIAVFCTHHIAYGTGTLAGFMTCTTPSLRIKQEVGPNC
jgi:glycosyltransferase involved in cell wall biosynthesis